MTKKVVAEDQIGHGFDDRNRSWKDAGVMTATSLQFGIFTIFGNRGLGRHDGSGGLKSDAEENWLAI